MSDRVIEIQKLVNDISKNHWKTIKTDIEQDKNLSETDRWLVLGRILNNLFNHHYRIAMVHSSDIIEKVENGILK